MTTANRVVFGFFLDIFVLVHLQLHDGGNAQLWIWLLGPLLGWLCPFMHWNQVVAIADGFAMTTANQVVLGFFRTASSLGSPPASWWRWCPNLILAFWSSIGLVGSICALKWCWQVQGILFQKVNKTGFWEFSKQLLLGMILRADDDTSDATRNPAQMTFILSGDIWKCFAKQQQRHARLFVPLSDCIRSWWLCFPFFLFPFFTTEAEEASFTFRPEWPIWRRWHSSPSRQSPFIANLPAVWCKLTAVAGNLKLRLLPFFSLCYSGGDMGTLCIVTLLLLT